jgi:hypothetical protein
VNSGTPLNIASFAGDGGARPFHVEPIWSEYQDDKSSGWYFVSKAFDDYSDEPLDVVLIVADGYFSSVFDTGTDWNIYFETTYEFYPGWAVSLEPIPPPPQPTASGGGPWS